MKVDQRHLDQTGASRLDKSQETQAVTPSRGHSGAARSGHGADRVSLSEFSGRLLEMANTDQPGHTERVAKLTAEVRSGRYQVDHAEVAKRLVHEATRDAA